VDLEPTANRNLSLIADQVLGLGEIARSSSELLRYWTRKEAVVKATGDGIGVGLTGVIVTPPENPPALLDYGGRDAIAVQMADLHCCSGYLASAAVLTDRAVDFFERWHAATESCNSG
jgi:4'-phosphopantetheinyl transferase